tara:strand:- start:37 stop:246 length:210 start_codon:yes stop_codon:yes gene_type:complete
MEHRLQEPEVAAVVVGQVVEALVDLAVVVMEFEQHLLMMLLMEQIIQVVEVVQDLLQDLLVNLVMVDQV